MRAVRNLAILFIAASFLDAWTTYQCLHAVVPGWDVYEANPVVAWMIEQTNLLGALTIDMVFSVAMICWLAVTDLVGERLKIGFLIFLIGVTGYAVVNNLQGMITMGIL